MLGSNCNVLQHATYFHSLGGIMQLESYQVVLHHATGFGS